jgi:hypothetical protein
MKDKKDELLVGMIAVLGIFFVVPVIGGLITSTVFLGAASIPIWGVVSLSAWLALKGPVGKAIGEKILGDGRSGGLTDEDLAELEDLRARVAELEERQDFSERLLAQRNESARIESPR